MKKIATLAFVGTLLQLICMCVNYFLYSFDLYRFLPTFWFQAYEVLRIIGLGMVCFFFYAIWKGQK